MHIYDALRDLVPFVQFKKREKHSWGVLILVKLQAWGINECSGRPIFIFFIKEN